MEKRRTDALTIEETFELDVGPHAHGVTAFASEDDRRAAWAGHRAALLVDETAGVRPWAFWRYDPDVPAELRDVEALTKRLRIPATDLDWWAGRGAEELDRRRRVWLA